ncbi:hypothetical protein FHETE_3914 [Fusarium heterosporum]|uniref:Heterokaryon incompatibility domain-containing protein n=1 Tax=Fusarium heterosporum TaxID=42747 RepID=A0A8H5TMA6_FUSHE|nr:hypothetical protein FHETE_3914 [Fusarium heterosporum]
MRQSPQDLARSSRLHAQPTIFSTDFARLQQPAALASKEFSNCVSPLIRQAMYLTSVIDERYLWADSLCITHHDREAALEQLQSMGAIYANAVVTIVAADGDSESGLPGIKGLSCPREMRQNVIPFGDEQLIVRNTFGLDEMIFFASRPQPYYSRGWTFQDVWHEETTLYTEIDDEVGPGCDILMAGFPDEWFLGKYIDAYNQRSLTFSEDALPAISGLLSVLSRSFPGGFVYGIPEMFFDHSLCWRPYFSRELERRVLSTRPIEDRFISSDLPSWSWLGWKGSINTCNDTAIRVNKRQSSIEEAFPITEWYASNSPTCPQAKRRRIRSTWYENRDVYKDFTKPMPPGWSRRDVAAQPPPQSEPRLYPEGCDRYVFKHESMPEHNGEPLEWFYPFPVHEIQVSTPPSVPEQTQFLFCETVQAQLSGYRLNTGNVDFPDDWEFRLYDGVGNHVGKLHPTWDANKKEYTSQITKQDFYLVLWIEWVNGVAYRLASGKVGTLEWESLNLENISLVLGLTRAKENASNVDFTFT